jgi:hypothetical protein
VYTVARIHNGRMRSACQKLVLTGTLLLAAFAGMGLAACGQEPANVDPQQVLSAASAKMGDVAGFHFVYEVHQPESAETRSSIVSITGDINSDGDMQANVEMYSGGFLVNAEFVALGDTHYIKTPLSTDWIVIAASESPIGTLNLATGTIRVLDNVTNAKYEGTDKRGGAKTYHISGSVAAAEVEAIAGSTDTESPFPTDIFIGIDDDFVYEVDITGSATRNEVPEVWRSIVLSVLEVAPDIKAPQ